MFAHTRYQTGELNEVVEKMKSGNIPCMDVDDYDEYNWVIKQLENIGLYKVDKFSHDINARDRLKEPEFEFRDAFADVPVQSDDSNNSKLMYIDFYFEPIEDETYDSIGEI